MTGCRCGGGSSASFEVFFIQSVSFVSLELNPPFLYLGFMFSVLYCCLFGLWEKKEEDDGKQRKMTRDSCDCWCMDFWILISSIYPTFSASKDVRWKRGAKVNKETIIVYCRSPNHILPANFDQMCLNSKSLGYESF